MRTQVMDDLIKLFAKNPIWTLQEMAEHLSYSEVSVRRFLKRVGYVRSYTHNGKCYTLQRIAQFNSQGIWRHEQTGFSKHGTLVQTINHLIHKSPMGLSAAELTGILESPCQSFLSNQYKAGKLDRIKPGPEYIYLAMDSKTNQRQRDVLNKRFTREDQHSLSAEQAVFVLVQFINNPSLSFKQLARLLRKHRQVVVSAECIEAFFHTHHIKKNDMPDMKH
jgi:hypothetical protein